MFDAGGVFVSPNILSFLSWDEIYVLVERHKHGDYGDITEEQRSLNVKKITKGVKSGRVRSRYLINGWWVLVSSIPGAYTNVLLEDERHRWRNV